jgi:hypothetical protein
VALAEPRPMREGELADVRVAWWRLRRQGVPLPAELGVILIGGGRA